MREILRFIAPRKTYMYILRALPKGNTCMIFLGGKFPFFPKCIKLFMIPKDIQLLQIPNQKKRNNFLHKIARSNPCRF